MPHTTKEERDSARGTLGACDCFPCRLMMDFDAVIAARSLVEWMSGKSPAGVSEEPTAATTTDSKCSRCGKVNAGVHTCRPTNTLVQQGAPPAAPLAQPTPTDPHAGQKSVVRAEIAVRDFLMEIGGDEIGSCDDDDYALYEIRSSAIVQIVKGELLGPLAQQGTGSTGAPDDQPTPEETP